jgi:hypothetical protein
MLKYLVELRNFVGDDDEEEPFLFTSLLINKESGFGVCIVIEELTQGEEEEE